MQAWGGSDIDLIIHSRSKSSENQPLGYRKTVRNINQVNLASKTRWPPKNDRGRGYWTGKFIIPMPAEMISALFVFTHKLIRVL